MNKMLNLNKTKIKIKSFKLAEISHSVVEKFGWIPDSILRNYNQRGSEVKLVLKI